MAWDDTPPTAEELKSISTAWDATPPTPEELGQVPEWKTNLSAIARPVLEMGGAVGGSLLAGGPETPVGIAGGALGYAAGKSAADLVSRSLGVQQPIKDITQAVEETAGNIKSGAEVEAANLLVNPILKGIGKAAVKGASTYFGPSIDAIQARLADPSIASSSFPKTAEELSSNLNNLQTNLNGIEDKVWGSLLKLKAEPKSNLLGMINGIKRQIKVSGTGQVASDADQMAMDALDRLSGRIKAMKTTSSDDLILPSNRGSAEFLDQNQLRQIIQSVSKDVNWSDPGMTPKNEALVNFRHSLSEYLKGENPRYADLIQQSADRSALLQNAERAFSLDKVRGQYEPSNATMGKLQSLLKPNNVASQEVAGKVKDLTGMDLQNEVQKSKYAQEFETTAIQGSRRAVIGKAIGGALGSLGGDQMGQGYFGGAALGAMAGGWLDKNAAQNLGSSLDLINRLGLTNSSVNPIASLGLLAAMAGKSQD